MLDYKRGLFSPLPNSRYLLSLLSKESGTFRSVNAYYRGVAAL